MIRFRELLCLTSAIIALASPPLAGQTPRAPMFVDAWMGGPLDSIYNAEFPRVQAICRGQGDACYAAELDTTAVQLAPVFEEPGATEPVGAITARLRPRGAWPYAGLVFADREGREVPLLEDLGDWGYGTTLEVTASEDGWVRPWLLEQLGGYWLSVDGAPGFGVVDGPYGLDGRLWRLGPVRVAGSSTELPSGVYMILAVENGTVRLRSELPSDMDCGEPTDAPASQDAPSATIYSVPLTALIDAAGRAALEPAYPKGC